MEMKSKTVNCT